MALVVAGSGVLALATDHFRAWTSEGARRLAVLESPVTMPNPATFDQDGEPHFLLDFDKRFLVLDFIYTRCATVCLDLGRTIKTLQEDFRVAGLQKDVQFLSVGFDYTHDTSEALRGYLQRYAADTANWSALRLDSLPKLQKLLKKSGVVVLPAADGGYVHNTAIYLIDRGSLVGIFDWQDQQGLTEALWQRKTDS